MIDILAEAGWVTPTAAHYLILLRQGGGTRTEHRLELTDLYQSKGGKNIDVKPGDVIVAPRMEVFYVYGEVHKPGMYRLEPGITVMRSPSPVADRKRPRNAGLR